VIPSEDQTKIFRPDIETQTQNIVDSVLQEDNSLDITDQVARKMHLRRDKLASKNQKVSAEDFSDLATPVKSTSEVETKEQGVDKNNGVEVALTDKSIVTTEISKTMPTGVTIADVSQEEETPMPARKKRTRRGVYNAAVGKEFDFTAEESNIEEGDTSVRSSARKVKSFESSQQENTELVTNEQGESSQHQEATNINLTEVDEETPVRKVRSKKGTVVDAADFTGIMTTGRPGPIVEEDTQDSVRVSRHQSAKQSGGITTLQLSPLINTPSPSTRSYTNQVSAKSKASESKDNVDKSQLDEIQEEKGNQSENEIGVERQDRSASTGKFTDPTPDNDISIRVEIHNKMGSNLEEVEENDILPHERDILLSESRARRAARKSEVLGHFVKAPCLSNIVETSENPSRPSSGLRTSSEMVSRRSSMEVISRRTSSDPQSAGKTSGMISIVEEKENNDKTGVADDEVSNESKDTNVITTRHKRRSVYQAGIPDQPIVSSAVIPSEDQTKIFRPDIETQTQNIVDSVLQEDNSLDITDQVARKMHLRRDKLASKNQKVSAEDFSDLATPVKSTSEVETKEQGVDKNNGVEVALTDKSIVTTEISKTMPTGVTIADVSQEEETPMPARKKRTRRGVYNAAVGKEFDFTAEESNIEEGDTSVRSSARKVKSFESSQQENTELVTNEQGESSQHQEATNINLTEVDEETPVRKVRSKKGTVVDAADFTGIMTTGRPGPIVEEDTQDSVRVSRHQSAKQSGGITTLQLSPLINTPSPSTRSYTNQVSAKSKASESKDNVDKSQLDEIQEEKGNQSENEIGVERQDRSASTGKFTDPTPDNDISIRVEIHNKMGSNLEEVEENDILPHERDILLSESRARRAARKSEVLGHFVKAPCLSNIVETSENPSRPSSGLRTSSEMVSRRSSMEVISRRTSSDPQSAGKTSGMISIVEEKENNDGKTGVADDKVSTALSNESKDTDVITTKHKRRSVYQAGIPDQPIDSSMILSADQTKIFRPDIESTRLGNMTGITDMSPPMQDTSDTRPGARPGRDTSTPAINRSNSVRQPVQTTTTEQSCITTSDQSSARNTAESCSTSSERAPIISTQTDPVSSPSRRSYLPPVPSKLTIPSTLSQTEPHQPLQSRQDGRLSKTLANKTMMSVTSGTQYETPEKVRESRRSSKRLNLRQSLYKTRIDMEDIAEGGTQTTPNLEKTTTSSHPPRAAPELSETGCQVTPSLQQPVLHQTVEAQNKEISGSEDQNISVTQDSVKVSKHQAAAKESIISPLPYSPLVNTPSTSNRKNEEDIEKDSKDYMEENRENDEWAFPQYQKNNSKVLIDSFTEVDLEEYVCENDSSDVEDLNITGRKNPSPLLEGVRDPDGISDESNEEEKSGDNEEEKSGVNEEEKSGDNEKEKSGDNEDEKSDDNEDEDSVGFEEEYLDEKVEGNEFKELDNAGKEQLVRDELVDDTPAESPENTEDNCSDDEEIVEEGDDIRVEKECHQTNIVCPPISAPIRPMLEPEVRVLPNSKERKEMRQATLVRYLGIQDTTARQGLETLLTPQQTKKRVVASNKPKPVKEKPKTYFPAKNVKFDFNRFSRFKLKKDAEGILMDASQDFMDMAMARLSDIAEKRGADRIHLCDIRRLFGECGYVKPVEEDPNNRHFYSLLREVCREDLVRELIPCNMGDGTVYPPEDIWQEKGGKKKGAKPSTSKASLASGSRVSLGVSEGRSSTAKKADKVKRFKVAEDLDTSGPKRPRLTKNGGKGRKNIN